MSKEQKSLSKEELLELLKTNELSWSDIADIANTLKQGEIKPEEKTIQNETNEITFSVNISYPDLILTRTKGKNVQQIVISITCNSCYLKTNLQFDSSDLYWLLFYLVSNRLNYVQKLQYIKYR